MRTKNSKFINILTGVIGTTLLMVFVVGLAHSIATGFAGFEGALPFILIVAFVLCLVLYDLWDQTMRARNQTERDR
jgi:sterol desaturase/sphingolipid hydroxylase (fatty acid hydroxylase superfamily)